MSSYSNISRAKSKVRSKQAGVSSALDAAPSPVGRGRGKSCEQDYAKFLFQLIPSTLLRGSNSIYYLRTDQVPANPGFHKVKNLAFMYIEKKVLIMFPVPPELVQEVLNTRLTRLNAQLRNIRGLTAAQVEAAKKQRADARRRAHQLQQGQDKDADEVEQAQDEQQGGEEQGGGEGVEGEAAVEEQQQQQPPPQQQQQGGVSGCELPSKNEEAAYRAWLKCEGEQGKLYKLAIKGSTPKNELLDDAVLTAEEQNAALKLSAAQAATQGGVPASDPAHKVLSSAAAALKQRLDAAAGAGQGSSAATAGRGNTSNAQDASPGCSGAGGRRGSRHTAPDSDTADEDSGDNDFSDDDDEDDEVEAAGALTSMHAAGQAAAAGGRGPMKRQQQKKKQKATAVQAAAKRARVVAPPTLPEQPGAPRLSSRETRPNPKYTD